MMKEISVRDGAAVLAADAPDPAEVVFFIAGRTGMQVKRRRSARKATSSTTTARRLGQVHP